MALLLSPHFQALDGNGDPYSGALLYFYLAGTSTAVTVYQDAGETTPHASPVVADASGRFDQIYLPTGSTLKLVLKTSAGVTVQTIDRVIPGGVSSDSYFAKSGALVYELASSTSGDPGPGKFGFDSGTPGSSTGGQLDDLDYYGAAAAARIARWDDSTSAIKGTAEIAKLGDPTVRGTVEITAQTDSTGYRTVTWAPVSGTFTGTFTAGDLFGISFTRTGDAGGAVFVVQGRLTLTSGDAVTASDVASAATLYFTPFRGNSVALYNGASWDLHTLTEISIALSGGTASKPHDVFVYDNSGTLTLELVAWSSDTARASALATQDGVYVKTGAATHLYLGSVYLNASKNCNDNKETRHLWNMYNRVSRVLSRKDSAANWTYTTAAFRQANGSTSNRVSMMRGLNEDSARVSVLCAAVNTTATAGLGIAIGLDSSTTVATECINGAANALGSTVAANINLQASYEGMPGTGLHELRWLEYSAASGTTTWQNSNGSNINSGMSGSCWA